MGGKEERQTKVEKERGVKMRGADDRESSTRKGWSHPLWDPTSAHFFIIIQFYNTVILKNKIKY